jgi:ankyrin repeat protein
LAVNNKIDALKSMLEKDDVDPNLRRIEFDTQLLNGIVDDEHVLKIVANVKEVEVDGSDIEDLKETALSAASRRGHLEVVKALIEKGADVTAAGGDFGSAIQAAAFGGHNEIISTLLENGGDVAQAGGCWDNALRAACGSGKLHTVKYLIDNGADIHYGSAEDEVPFALDAAAREGHIHIAKYLVESGVDIHASGYYPNALYPAASWNRHEMLRFLLLEGLDVNAQNSTGDSALRSAAEEGHIEIVKLLIAEGADPNLEAPNIATILETALGNGRFEVVDYLLEHGADPLHTGGYYPSILFPAAALSDPEQRMSALGRFINLGVDPDAVADDGATALKCAVSVNHLDAVQFLVQHGANATAEPAPNCLHLAAAGGFDDVLAFFYDNGPCVDSDTIEVAVVNHQASTVGLLLQRGGQQVSKELKNNFLCQAAGSNDMEIATTLLEHGASPNYPSDEGMALLVACAAGNMEMAKLLVQHGADVNQKSDYTESGAISAAARSGHFELVKWLISKGADIDTTPNPLIEAASIGNEDIVKILLDNGASTEGLEGGIMCSAAESGNVALAKLLIETGINVKALGGMYNSLIHAVQSGNIEMVSLIIDTGFDINDEGIGSPALCTAIEIEEFEIADYLIEKGADVHVLDIFGRSLITVAAAKNNIHLVEKFISLGVDINQYSEQMGDALFAAAEDGFLDLVNLLISKGIDISTRGTEKPTALVRAIQAKHHDVVETMLKNGAVLTAEDFKLVMSEEVPNGRLDHIEELLKFCESLSPDQLQPILVLAAQHDQKDIANFLLRKGATAAGNENEALFFAAKTGSFDIVELLLQKGASVDTTNRGSPLNAAVVGGSLEIIDLLRNRGASVSTTASGEALCAAIEREDIEILTYLLQNGADISQPVEEKESPLAFALEQSNEDILEALFRNLDIETAGESALSIAAASGSSEHVQMLLDRGVSSNAKGGPYGNAIYAAAFRGHEEVIRLLLENRVDPDLDGGFHTDEPIVEDYGTFQITTEPDTKQIYRGTAINVAAENGHIDIVKALLESGATIGGSKLLHFAVSSGDEELVRLALDQGVSVNVYHIEGGTPLTAAAAAGFSSIVQLLLDRGAEIHWQGGQDSTPLASAVDSGDLETITALLDAGADPNNGGDPYITPLFKAVVAENIEIVSLLIEREADVNVFLGYNDSALAAAVSQENLELVNLLLAHGADVNDERITPSVLTTAAASGNAELVQALVSAGANANLKNGYPIQASGKNLTIIKLLANIDLNTDSEIYGTPLSSAVTDGHTKIVKYLLDRGVDPSKLSNGKSPLEFAAEGGHLEIVKLLVNKGAQLSPMALKEALSSGNEKVADFIFERMDQHNLGKMPNILHGACQGGNLKMVQKLLDCSSDVNSISSDLGTPLQCAVIANKPQVVALLLEHGADVNISSDTSNGLLGWWSDDDSIDVTRLLVDGGWNISEPGNPLLTKILPGSNKEVLELLVSKGTDVNAKNEHGHSPLYWFVGGEDSFYSVKLLVENGADPSAAAKDGSTPLTQAVVYKNKKLIDFLISSGADINDGPMYPILAAAEIGDLDMVKHLINKGANTGVENGDIGGLLHVAAYHGQDDIIEYALGLNFDANAPRKQFGPPLRCLLEGPAFQQSTVDLLIKKGNANPISVPESYNSILQRAAQQSDIDFLKLLLKDHPEIPSGGEYGNPLQAAAESGNISGIRFLIEEIGMDVNIRGGRFETPLQAAATYPSVSNLQYLLEMGADPSIQGGEFGTALQAAVFNGQGQNIIVLLRAGADSKQAGKYATLREAAIVGEQVEALETLLQELNLNPK